MKRETIHPKDRQHWLELRSHDITSTEVPALFGVSSYLTEFELFHRLKDKKIIELEPNERMLWGTRLQDAVARGIAEDQGWKISLRSQYQRLPEHRLGASFDYDVVPLELLEVKVVDGLQFRDQWIVDGDTIEAPPHIELQAQAQLAVSGRSRIYIGALVGGNRPVLIRREPDPEIIAAILAKADRLWDMVDRGVEPQPDFVRDAAFIAKLYGQSEPGKIIEANPKILSLAQEYAQWGKQEKEAAANKQAFKAMILTEIGNAEKVLGEGFSISAGTVAGASVTYERESYRNFRINWSKKKELSSGKQEPASEGARV